MTSLRFLTPLAPATLQERWRDIRARGRTRFVVKYGVLRFAPLIAGPSVGVTLAQQGSLPPLRWLALAAMFTTLGVIWGVITWRYCETEHQKREAAR